MRGVALEENLCLRGYEKVSLSGLELQDYALLGPDQRLHLYAIKTLQTALYSINEAQQPIRPDDLVALMELVSILARRYAVDVMSSLISTEFPYQ